MTPEKYASPNQPQGVIPGFQALIEKHPDILAGEQIDSVSPRRWLLITREMLPNPEQKMHSKIAIQN